PPGGSPQSLGSVVSQRRWRSLSFHHVPSPVRLKKRPRAPTARCPTTWPREYRRTSSAPQAASAATPAQIATNTQGPIAAVCGGRGGLATRGTPARQQGESVPARWLAHAGGLERAGAGAVVVDTGDLAIAD